MAFMNDTVSNGTNAVRDAAAHVLHKGSDIASTIGDTIVERSSDLLDVLKKQVKSNPFAAIGIAFAGGLVIAGTVMMMRRRRR